jgi:hypothetical protein
VSDPNSFIATEVYEDQAALERQEELPEVAKALGVLETSLVAAPEATIFRVSTSEPWVERRETAAECSDARRTPVGARPALER